VKLAFSWESNAEDGAEIMEEVVKVSREVCNNKSKVLLQVVFGLLKLPQ